MKKTLAVLAFGVAASAGAQVFSFHNYQETVGNGPGTFNFDASGTATVAGPLVSLVGHMTAASDVYSSRVADTTTLVAQPFPSPPLSFRNTIDVSYSIPSVGAALNIDPVAPTPAGLGYFRAAFPASPISFDVTISYVLRENGAIVSTDSKSYTVHGQLAYAEFNVFNYPTSLGVYVPGFMATPDDTSPLWVVVPPHGASFTIYPSQIGVPSPVPEPVETTMLAALALAGVGFWLRRLRQQ